jgi:hypothetical protein
MVFGGFLGFTPIACHIEVLDVVGAAVLERNDVLERPLVPRR